MVRVLVPITTDSEEIESVSIIDTLVRAGASVTVASAENQLQVRCSRGVNLVADVLLSDVAVDTLFDAIAIPGGSGAKALASNAHLSALLQSHYEAGRIVAAVCAAPALVLAPLGLLDGKRATGYPATHDNIPNCVRDEAVVRDGNVITATGPATSIRFAIEIADALFGAEMSATLRKQMLVD